MANVLTSRPTQRFILSGLLLFSMLVPTDAQLGARRGPTAPSRPPGFSSGAQRPTVGPHGGEHLAQWMDRHSNLPLAEQQRALEREPGFRELSPQVQQRMRDRLTQLNQMPPAKRERIIARTEAMERLAPEQRQQVRGAMAQVSSLPPERRRAVIRAYHQLHNLPLAQQQAELNSPNLRGNFSEQERAALSGLVTVEPLIPNLLVPPPAQQQPR